MKYAITFILGLLTSGMVRAQQINLKPGEEFAYQTHNTEVPVGSKARPLEEAYTFQFKVISSNATECKLQCTLTKAKLWQADKLYRLNADSVRNTELNYSGLLTQLILLNQPFTVVLNPKGKFMRAEGIADLIKKATASWYLEENVQQYQQGNIEGFLSRLNWMFLSCLIKS
ncbi:hypothetical protein [Mucilaginibacter antarcticus]|uniref:hypothetical protein n=1 Tax=Mucilaginibacter antarcticus TaxID=1855725 RepID=UPI00363BA023